MREVVFDIGDELWEARRRPVVRMHQPLLVGAQVVVSAGKVPLLMELAVWQRSERECALVLCCELIALGYVGAGNGSCCW